MAKKPTGFKVGNVQYGRFSGVNPNRAANENATIRERVNKLKSLTAETDRMLKADKSYKLNSGKAAYGPKPSAGPSMGSRIAGAAGTVARGVMRVAGPAGALAGMTTPAGAGSDKPPKYGMSLREMANKKSQNMKAKTNTSVRGGQGAVAFGNVKSKVQSSKTSVTGGRGVTAFGGSSKDQSRMSQSRGGGYMGPKSATKTSNQTTNRGSNKPSNSMSAPNRTASSKSNLGTSRF